MLYVSISNHIPKLNNLDGDEHVKTHVLYVNQKLYQLFDSIIFLILLVILTPYYISKLSKNLLFFYNI